MKGAWSVLVLALVLAPLFAGTASAAVTIGDITYTPEHPSTSDTITVSVTVTADAGVKMVTVSYVACAADTCGIPTQPVEMTKSGDTYTATIGPFKDTDEHVTVTITAEDMNGEKSTKDIEIQLGAGSGGNAEEEGNSSSTPGFEMAIGVLALAAAVLIAGRKRN